MKIVDIQKSKYNDYYIIKLDNQVSFTSTIEDLIKYDIKEGRNYTVDEINEIIYNCEFSRAYNYSLKILGIKRYTTKEVREKMINKGFSNDIVNKVIEKLTDYNLLDDEKYAIMFINDCLNKKVGTRNIRLKLLNKGIKVDLKEIDIDEDEIYKNAKTLALKKLRNIKDSKHIKGRLYNFLSYKGYESDLVLKVLREILNDNFEDGD
ncbi:Regulatory protein RecX [Caloramator mitchellensis]|uniref:Regulatory protein RecX n=1 Tax=Caloramator mitchellensis TaxID=908809 RepID=A0A0R3K3V7_CALMK|nr:regulatory protein RecX [Caloramator mitchellensis]KRQ87007.1 Regulatory protein RecX [Caloramator mitchellensis]